MGALNKSFLWGTGVASITWCISLYLYWLLVHNSEDELDASTIIPKQSYFPSNHVNDLSPHIEKAIDKENSKQQYLDKAKRYKKEQKLKKISRKLINELQPIEPVGDDEFGMVRNEEEKFLRDIGYKRHAFNTLVSSKIGLFRDIPDTRHKLCAEQKYSSQLPTVSIIICFYNEHIVTLLRSVDTILQRTPSSVLKEIILVDDYSDLDDLKETLEKEIDKINVNNTIRLVRNDKREGLIRSRVYGARNATSEVLLFLDSHIEVNVQWIEPLLARVKENRTALVMPVIDIINADTFSYTSSPLVRGGFNWGLHFKWDNLPTGTLTKDTDFLGPFPSPTMAGGLFAVNRLYFKELGEYDLGMDVWGGENIEISFRAWQCGGSIELLPCSRIGHVFRKRRPYGSLNGVDTMIRNSLRAAHVWMDDYIDYFLQQQPTARLVDYGDISDRQQLRQSLHCKNFSWYLKNIYPEQELPGESKVLSSVDQPKYQPWHSRKRNYINTFMIRLTNTTLCIAASGPKEKGFWKRGSSLKLAPCLRVKNQMWYETDRFEFVLGQLLCLEASGGSSSSLPVINKCHEMGGDQEWKHRKSDGSPIYNIAAGTCLRAREPTKSAAIELALCSNNLFSTWDLISGDI
ncbi:polypeptide N-acetylgalactosaminyltransferase 35A [Bradysia coprophila]|uniref:polypeptide N-acetylgalactosaminyltransferase 35A n=1 Tax=Bradysia coprophila TaxID=38358 RepID=UPI00187D6EB6|nr:polypeptide N-acetylgalactosaminyltransferase 35A [Bradysia coprophila]